MERAIRWGLQAIVRKATYRIQAVSSLLSATSSRDVPLQWAKEKNLEVEICSDYDELLEKVDAVSICTPNYAHGELAVRAMEKGTHLLCEKPLSIDSESSVRAVSIARC